MTSDAKKLHKLVEDRENHVKDMNDKIRQETKERNSTISKIRDNQSSLRIKKIEEKENERKTLSRTLMTKLVSASDYPDCPPYVPHMINVMKNVLGNFFY